MRRGPLALVLLVVLGAALWWFVGRDRPESVVGRTQPPATAAKADVRGGSKAPATQADDPAPEPTAKKRRVDQAEREAVRKKILEGIREHQARAQTPEPEPERPDTPEPEPSGGSGGVRDRSDGKLTNLIGTINDDFMPLADECYEQARETDPELAGMLDINFKVIADEDIGGLVDEVELGEENEVDNAGMLECMRETLLSTIFPSPNETGEQGVRLTLRFNPDE